MEGEVTLLAPSPDPLPSLFFAAAGEMCMCVHVYVCEVEGVYMCSRRVPNESLIVFTPCW